MSTTNIKEGVTLKSLQSRLEKEKAELSAIQSQISDLQCKSKEHNKRISGILHQIKQLTKDELQISEHALLRFLERVELLPIEQVKDKIITEELKKMWKILGNGEFPIGIGEHTCTIKNGIIITVY